MEGKITETEGRRKTTRELQSFYWFILFQNLYPRDHHLFSSPNNLLNPVTPDLINKGFKI